MSDLMRSQFEDWQLQVYCGGSERLRKCKNDESYYYYTDVQLKWKAWKASRECLVIELPEPRVARGYGEQVAEALGFNDGISYCEEAIHAAGVKTK